MSGHSHIIMVPYPNQGIVWPLVALIALPEIFTKSCRCTMPGGWMVRYRFNDGYWNRLRRIWCKGMCCHTHGAHSSLAGQVGCGSSPREVTRKFLLIRRLVLNWHSRCVDQLLCTWCPGRASPRRWLTYCRKDRLLAGRAVIDTNETRYGSETMLGLFIGRQRPTS